MLIHNDDKIGARYGRWGVIDFGTRASESRARPYYLCVCDCGDKREVNLRLLENGQSKSCGCLKKEKLSERSKSHGLSKHKLYWVWHKMVKRCEDKNHRQFKDYGGRGIFICSEWRNNYILFYEWSILNGYTEGLQIDRVNNNYGYSPTNCRWATRTVQQRNKRNNRWVDFFGEKWILKEISETFSINLKSIQGHLYRGKDIYSSVFSLSLNKKLWS